MLRSKTPVRSLGTRDSRYALDTCLEDPVTNVFVAARILEGQFASSGSVLYSFEGTGGPSLCWASANVVPVSCGTTQSRAALAQAVEPRRRWTSSLFGPADDVQELWQRLEGSWGVAREVRAVQPVLTMRTSPSAAGVPADPKVRLARIEELDLVVPAAEAMFTEEIGYPPYRGTSAAYRRGVAGLIGGGRTLVRIEDGEVVFKADLGSIALGVAQIQGVWVHPQWRGMGVAVPAMAAVVDHILQYVAPTATLYVNDFNSAALATYRHVGFRQTGTFSTVLL